MSKHAKILIVDDELNIRRILQMAFEKLGHQVLVAEDARVALELLAENNFDLVITDVTMPGMNGYELQNIVHENQPDVPVIIMTAYGTIPQAVAAIRNGAYEYITKPFDLDQLKKIVASALEGDSKPKARGKKAAKHDLGGNGTPSSRFQGHHHDRRRERRRKRSRIPSDSCLVIPKQEAIRGRQLCSFA